MRTASARWVATRVLVGLMAAYLAACGGGGGDDGPSGPTLVSPPSSPATLSATTTEASQASQAGTAQASNVAAMSFFLEFAAGETASGTAPLSINGLVARAAGGGREQQLAVRTVSCREAFPTATSCTGNIVIDSNVPETAQVIPAGSYFSASYNGLSVTLNATTSFALDGTFRVDAETSYNTANPAGARLRATFSNARYSYTGGPFGSFALGPFNLVALYEWDSQGQLTVTVDGVRISRVSNVDFVNDRNYSLSNVTVRSAHWASSTGYVETTFTSWSVVNGRPATGSSFTSVAGSNSIAVSVTSSSTNTVVYDVRINVNGAQTRYTVTATYPTDGGAPTYTVVQVVT